MTANARPNLGGLFSGTTPPERSSSIAGALGPRAGTDEDRTDGDRIGVPPGPAAPRSPSTPPPATTAARVGAGSSPDPGTGTGTPAPQHAGDQWAAVQWLDPVRALGFYFDVLQGMFDAHRRLTMAVATAVTAPVRRAGVWR